MNRFMNAIDIARTESEQMVKAVLLAIEAHKGQEYGPGIPYVSHLMEVDSNVVKHFKPKGLKPHDPYSKEPGDEMDNLRAIAYLHDTLEDTDLTSDDLRAAGINEDVILAVECISKKPGQEYMAYMDLVCSNELARKVKLCDTLANLFNSIKEGNMKRIRKYTKQVVILEEGF